MLKTLLLFGVYFLSAITNNLFAQQSILPKKRFSFRTLNYENGLTNNVAINIITDANGFTWVSTLTSLQRFNGRELKTINPVAGNDTFKINYTVKFFALNDGSLWISTMTGILQFNPQSNAFSKIITTPPDQSNFSVLPIMQSEEGIWCLQKNKGIVLYNANGNFIKTYPFFDSSTINPILKNAIFSTTSISNNDQYIFLGSGDGNIYFFNIKNKDAGVIKISAAKILSFICTQTKLFALTASINTSMMLTVFDDNEKIFEAIKAGASGYLLKDEKIAVIIDYIQQLAEMGGAFMSPRIARKALDLLMNAPPFMNEKEDKQSLVQTELSPRETEVLKLLVDGYDYRSTAEKLFLSAHTVRKHIANIYEKLHVKSKAQAIKIAINNKLI